MALSIRGRHCVSLCDWSAITPRCDAMAHQQSQVPACVCVTVSMRSTTPDGAVWLVTEIQR